MPALGRGRYREQMAIPVERLAIVPLALGLAVLLWDILLAGWIASQKQAPKVFTTLTGLCGLLVAPAALVAMATLLEGTARTMAGITWIWPLVTSAFAIQVAYALIARLVTPAVGVPLLLYDLCIAAIAIGDYLVSLSGSAPISLQGAVAARDAVSGYAAGRAALVSPLALMVPIIAPAFPARWKASAVVRALLTITATAATTLLVMEWPRSVGAIRSYDLAIGVRMQERPARDFAIGLRMYAPLDNAPASRRVIADNKLADTIGVRAVLVVISEAAARGSVLDSLARLLEPWRSDSGSTIAIALELGRSPGAPNSPSRLATIERVLQRVRPDVLVPGWRAPLPSMLPGDEPDMVWWQTMLVSSASVIQRVRPRTLLGWSAVRVDARDSAMYRWAASPQSPVKVLGLVAYPSFAGLPAVDARLRAFDRWHAQAADSMKAGTRHWLMESGGLPRAHGDAAQTAAVMQALAWGTRRPWITVAILGDAGDYDGSNGLRAADGRIRRVVGVVSRASRGLRDAAIGAR